MKKLLPQLCFLHRTKRVLLQAQIWSLMVAKQEEYNLSETSQLKKMFDLTGKVAVITGGAGLLGSKHAEALAEAGAITVLLDIDQARSEAVAERISKTFGVESLGVCVDIANLIQIEDLNNSNLYVVSICDSKITHKLIKVD